MFPSSRLEGERERESAPILAPTASLHHFSYLSTSRKDEKNETHFKDAEIFVHLVASPLAEARGKCTRECVREGRRTLGQTTAVWAFARVARLPDKGGGRWGGG